MKNPVESNRTAFHFNCCLYSCAAFSAEVCAEQRRLHALPQSSSDPPPHPGHLCGQRDRGEHGGVAQGWFNHFFCFFLLFQLKSVSGSSQLKQILKRKTTQFPSLKDL